MKKLLCFCLLFAALAAISAPQSTSVEAYDVPIGPIEIIGNIR